MLRLCVEEGASWKDNNSSSRYFISYYSIIPFFLFHHSPLSIIIPLVVLLLVPIFLLHSFLLCRFRPLILLPPPLYKAHITSPGFVLPCATSRYFSSFAFSSLQRVVIVKKNLGLPIWLLLLKVPICQHKNTALRAACE